MSFSFSVTGKDRDEVKEMVAAKMSEIAEQQTAHQHDVGAICATVSSYLDLIEDKALEDNGINASVSGSVSWDETGSEGARMRLFRGASISVSVRTVPL